MRISPSFLMIWVVLSVFGAAIGGYVSYTQARARTAELNDVAPLQEGIDVVRIAELLSGAAEPELPEGFEESQAPSSVQPTAIPATLLPTEPPQDATEEPSVLPAATESPTGDGADVVATEAPVATAVAAAVDAEAATFGPRRVTILLMGIDQREGEEGPFPTDTMMVLSLNPAARTGVILSIPRDIYVTFPLGLGQGKINTANIVGDVNQLPGGGPAYAKRTVSELLGIPIDYYVMVNFNAFTTFMDAVGEVEVCPPEPIDDPDYPDGSYGTRPVYFEAGCQMLGSDRLLEYSRTRATANGDIDRAARQQEVMFAVRSQIVSVDGLTNLLRNASTIWGSINENIRTDLTFNEILGLAPFIEQVPRENIVNATIDYESVQIRELPSGEQVLVPIQTDIIRLVDELFR